MDENLAEIIQGLKNTNKGVIGLPNIDHEFTTGAGIFQTTGHFEAINGTIRCSDCCNSKSPSRCSELINEMFFKQFFWPYSDLTTIRRITNATLDHEKMKFFGSCGFGMDQLDLKFDHYEV